MTVHQEPLSSGSRDERIRPAQSRKACEVAVRRAQNESVLDSKHRKVSVGDEVRLDARQCQEFTEQPGVSLARLRNPRRVTTKPGLYLGPRVGDWLRALEHARVGHQPQERQQTWPGQAHPVRPVELLIEP